MRRTLVTSLFIFCCGVQQLSAAESGSFAAPDMEGFVKIQEYHADGDENGVKETLVRRFKNLSGDRMFTMTTKENLWSSSLDTAGDDDSQVEKNYVLRDSDCDGSFDERYTLDEQFRLPECLK